MKKFTLFISILIGVTGMAQESRAYLADNVAKQFSALGTIDDSMFFIAPSPIASGENAGAINPNDPSTGYVLDEAGNFYQLTVETGVYTLLGNMLSDWQGMEFDESTGILYAITTTHLYIIDPVAITATLVGSLGFTNGEHPIALGIYNGLGYIIESKEANSHTVNLATGATSLLGALYPNNPDADYIGDVGGMDGLNVVYTANYQYRYGFKSQLNPTTGHLGSEAFIDGSSVYHQEHGWYSYGELFPDTSSCVEPIYI